MEYMEPFSLSDDLFIENVKNNETSDEYQTLSLTNTPVMLLSFAANQFMEDASTYFKKTFGLGSVDWRMLFLLALQPGSTAAQASKTIGVDKGTVSRSVSRLTESSLIVSGDLHANGRSRGLTLTKKGLEIHNKLLQSTLIKNRLLMKGFDESEVKMFCDLLIRFTANLEELSVHLKTPLDIHDD